MQVREWKSFVPFCIPLYTLLNNGMLYVWFFFFSILNFGYFIRKVKRIKGKKQCYIQQQQQNKKLDNIFDNYWVDKLILVFI